MSWIKNRQTKHEEDRAYSLLGIFDISMPLIYGEGAEKAFGRLRQEIYNRSKKHKLDELSIISHTSNPTKRLKTLYNQPSSIPSNRNQNFLNPEPPFYSARFSHSIDVAQQADHVGFFWIQGNPGTGKSTLMKLLFEVAELNAKDDPSQIMLSFFFLARGTVEEKSTTGLYRSLLH